MEIGVAYYPEHWPESRWDEDFALMAKAGITLVRMAEFAWCRLEPREGEFDFDWLDRAVELAAGHGVRSLLCTPTEAPPPWMSVNYPETRPWSPGGLPFAQGGRRHVDAASPAFCFFSERITREMGARFGANGNVAGWQLDNEIGAHTHFVSTSPWAAARFREWLRRRYGTVEALNEAWGLAFWSGEVREWSEVEMQTVAPTGQNPAYRKELRDFGQAMWMDFLRRQADILRPLCPGQFITHNVAWYGEQLDVWRLHEFLDVVGIDMYQRRPETQTATDDLYRAAGRGKPWAVLEMPSSDGTWEDEEGSGPATGRLTATLVKHAASGAKFASLFRFMPSPSGSEQFSFGGVRDAFGRPTATVEACARAREIIARLAPLEGRERNPEVAIVHDTDDLIFSEMMPVEGRRRIMFNDYPRELHEIHHQLASAGHRPTFAPLTDDLSAYRLVFVWDKLTIRPEHVDAIRRYVEAGGTVVANYCLGYLNHAGRRTWAPLPYRLTDVFGCTVRDMLRLSEGGLPRIAVGPERIEATGYGVTLEPLGGEVLATWDGWAGEHRAAMVAHRFGKGRTIYVGGLLERPAWEVLMPVILERAAVAWERPIGRAPGLECFPERGAWFCYNDNRRPIRVPVTGAFTDLVTGRQVKGDLALDGYAVAVLDPR